MTEDDEKGGQISPSQLLQILNSWPTLRDIKKPGKFFLVMAGLPVETTTWTCGTLTAMIIGTEWLIEASGCETENLRDVDLLSALFQGLITELDLQLVGEVRWHRFPAPGGITGFALLSESHLACHTYPEYGLATINLYCCRARPEWRWAEALRETLGATNVRVRTIERTVAEEDLKLEDSPLVAVARQS